MMRRTQKNTSILMEGAMSEVGEVLAVLSAQDIQLMAEGDQLRYDAPEDAITDEVLTLLRQHKAALLAWLAQPAPANDAAATAPSTQEVCPEQEHLSPPPPPYPGSPIGAPFRPGHQVWLYQWDTHAPRFDAPVTIVQMRTLWPGEQDIGWRNTTGALSWHNARLAIAVEMPEGRSPSPGARQA
jgi:hypothetical protein